MRDFLPWIAVAATVGAAVMAGLLFAFSNFVMRALSQGTPAADMAAMQRINVAIINPAFLFVFAGTALLSVALAVAVLATGDPAAHRWLLCGAAFYLVGVIGITAAFNVPLNDQLARTTVESAAEAWPRYVHSWLRWNHVRTIMAIAAVACLAGGVFELGRSGAPP